MFGLKDLNLKKRLLGYIVACQLLALVLGLGFGDSLPTAQAQQVEYNSNINMLVINPQDNSPWVFWRESNPQTFIISHFDATGKQLEAFRYTGEFYPKLMGVDFAPEAPRFYEYSRGGINEYNLKTGATRQLVSDSAFPGCSVGVGQLGYNAEAKHLYLACGSATAGYAETYYFVVEATTGKVLKKLDKGIVPVAAKPGTATLYAKKEYIVYNEYKQGRELYDIIALDIKTEQPTTAAPIATELSATSNRLDLFEINTKTGDIYFSTICCQVKGTAGTLFAYYAKQGLLKTFTFKQKYVYPLLVNEAAGQMYMRNFYYSNGYANDVYSLNDLEGPRLAQYDWHMLRADNLGMIYARLAHDSSDGNKAGLGLVVINPQTFSVMRSITLRAPDKIYQDKVTRLPAPPAGFKGRFFPETGHTLEGKFLDYWEKNGGLARFGYPITEPFYNEANVPVVQYFERHSFELHPENAGTPYEILLGTLGRNFSAFTCPRSEVPATSGETVAVPGGVLFKETQCKVTGKIYEYWKANGGLAQHGLPLTEPTQEVNPIDGKLYVVQYFERSRLELHPENAGTQYEVLMGHFGIQYLRAQGWNL